MLDRQHIPQKILRLPEVLLRTGLSRSSVYAKLDAKIGNKFYDPSFPKRIQLGPRAIGFLESELELWISSLAGP